MKDAEYEKVGVLGKIIYITYDMPNFENEIVPSLWSSP